MKRIVILLMSVTFAFAFTNKGFAQDKKDNFEDKWQVFKAYADFTIPFLTIKKMEDGSYELCNTKNKKEKWIGKYDKKAKEIHTNINDNDISITYDEGKDHILLRGRTNQGINFEMEREPKKAKAGHHATPK